MVEKKTIIIIASYADSLINFRGHLINRFIINNYNVIACAPDADKKIIMKINDLGARYKNLSLSRQSFNPFHDIKSFFDLKKIIYNEKPEIVISYTIKPVIYGSLAAFLCKTKRIYSIITGIGYALYGDSLKQKMVGKIVKLLYKISLKCNNKVFFQNPDDLNFFKQKKLIGNYTLTKLVNGSGVDLTYYYKCKTVSSPITFLLIARLLKEKGIFEFAKAAKDLKSKYPQTNFQIIGWEDNSPSSIKTEILTDMQKNSFIDFLGYKEDVRNYLASCSVYVLPSYREGTPRTVLEAMSMGRPIITTDAPGCRETVIDGKNGFLVPVRDSKMLKTFMEKFIIDKSLISKMGQESRRMAERKYDVNNINDIFIKELEI